MATRTGQVYHDGDGAVVLQEITTPSNEAGYSKLYPKVDGSLYCLNSSDIESKVRSGGRTYGELYAKDNLVLGPMGAQDQWFVGGGGSAGNLGNMTKQSGATGSITAFADYSGTVPGTISATSAGHGRSTGDIVVINLTSAPNDYSGVYEITVIDADTFYFTNAGWNATTTGQWQLPGALVVGANTDAIFEVSIYITIKPESANSEYDVALFVNDTVQDNIYSTVKTLLTTDTVVAGSSGLANLVTDDVVFFAFRNNSNNNGLYVVHGNMHVFDM